MIWFIDGLIDLCESRAVEMQSLLYKASLIALAFYTSDVIQHGNY